MKIEKFEDLESWKAARELVKIIYSITKCAPFSKDHGLKDQIQRAGVSVMANISEGFGCNSTKSFINFLSISYRSASEVESLLYVALDQNYIKQDDFDMLYRNSERIKSLIGGLTRYLRSVGALSVRR